MMTAATFHQLCALVGEFVILVGLTIVGIYALLILTLIALMPFTKSYFDELNRDR